MPELFAGMEQVTWDADHPASHFRCVPDCPCECASPDPYNANIGRMCRNCWGIIKRTHRIVTEPVLETDGITLYTSHREPLSQAGN